MSPSSARREDVFVVSRRCILRGKRAGVTYTRRALYTITLQRQGHGNHSVRRPGVSQQAPMSACATRPQGVCNRVVPTPEAKV